MGCTPRRASALAVGLWLAIGCRSGPEIPADFDDGQAKFRELHEAEIAGPRGPLSVREAHYVDPGHRFEARTEGGRLVAEVVKGDAGADDSESASGSIVAIVVLPDRIECARGCGPGPVPIEKAREVAIDPWVLGVSPQSGGLRVLVHDPAAPSRASFTGLRWFPPATRWWLVGTLEPVADAPAEPLATTRGLVKSMRRAGTLKVALPGGGTAALLAYEAGPDELLVPFTDATNGDASYDVGRYLTVPRPAAGDREVAIDFNRATNPWCAYSEHYNCPIPPAENRIDEAVEAGEQRYH